MSPVSRPRGTLPKHNLFAESTAYVERGNLRPVVDTVHPLSEIAAAHRALKAGGYGAIT
ncbi:zinc-binding dehydrogenase [Streptomyces sp. NPDC086771]|uniref:zinc-binding dehydrogenase n=1 Tax=unclassified Streptomyces TaxID=2593676 RepID=UPI00380983A6